MIRRIIAVNSQGTSIMEVGKDGITEIIDDCIEDEGCVLMRFNGFGRGENSDKNDILLRSMINLPMDVFYEHEDPIF